MNNATLFSFFLINLMLVLGLTVMMSGESIEMGCYIIGTEVNADYSTEYLSIGNCF